MPAASKSEMKPLSSTDFFWSSVMITTSGLCASRFSTVTSPFWIMPISGMSFASGCISKSFSRNAPAAFSKSWP